MLHLHQTPLPHHARPSAGSRLFRNASGRAHTVQRSRAAVPPQTVALAAATLTSDENPQMSTDYSSSDESDRPDGFEFNQDGVLAFRPHSVSRISAPPNARPILILPGFGNCTTDYEDALGSPNNSLANNLRARGFKVYVLGPLERKDWFRVARGVFTFKYWKGALTTDPGYTWYLERVAKCVKDIVDETGADKVDLMGHSAGGWLGRAFIGDPTFFPPGAAAAGSDKPHPSPVPHPNVGALITLGTPQRPPQGERARDMTGGAQGWVHTSYPGAFYQDQGVNYVSVCGWTVRGRRDIGPDGKVIYDTKRRRYPYEYAYDSYKEVYGDGQGLEGDAVVPLTSAFLFGARHVLIPGVWHSMSKYGTFDEAGEVVWYGSDQVIDQWLQCYVEECYKTA